MPTSAFSIRTAPRRCCSRSPSIRRIVDAPIGNGAVSDPNVSFDGRHVVFAYYHDESDDQPAARPQLRRRGHLPDRSLDARGRPADAPGVHPEPGQRLRLHELWRQPAGRQLPPHRRLQHRARVRRAHGPGAARDRLHLDAKQLPAAEALRQRGPRAAALSHGLGREERRADRLFERRPRDPSVPARRRADPLHELGEPGTARRPPVQPLVHRSRRDEMGLGLGLRRERDRPPLRDADERRRRRRRALLQLQQQRVRRPRSLPARSSGRRLSADRRSRHLHALRAAGTDRPDRLGLVPLEHGRGLSGALHARRPHVRRERDHLLERQREPGRQGHASRGGAGRRDSRRVLEGPRQPQRHLRRRRQRASVLRRRHLLRESGGSLQRDHGPRGVDAHPERSRGFRAVAAPGRALRRAFPGPCTARRLARPCERRRRRPRACGEHSLRPRGLFVDDLAGHGPAARRLRRRSGSLQRVARVSLRLDPPGAGRRDLRRRRHLGDPSARAVPGDRPPLPQRRAALFEPRVRTNADPHRDPGAPRGHHRSSRVHGHVVSGARPRRHSVHVSDARPQRHGREHGADLASSPSGRSPLRLRGLSCPYEDAAGVRGDRRRPGRLSRVGRGTADAPPPAHPALRHTGHRDGSRSPR